MFCNDIINMLLYQRDIIFDTIENLISKTLRIFSSFMTVVAQALTGVKSITSFFQCKKDVWDEREKSF